VRPLLLKKVEALAKRDSRIIFLAGDVGYGVTDGLRDSLKERFINAGVAEANMVSMAAGLGAAGLRPFLYSISPFLTLRCFEQIRNDLVYHRVPARLLGMGAGFTYGNQGPSHHALEDLHVMGSLPRLQVVNCANNDELSALFDRFENADEVVYFRTGKDTGPAHAEEAPGLAYRVSAGTDLNLVGSGTILAETRAAAETLRSRGVSVNLISCPCPYPFPTAEMKRCLVEAPVLSVIEAYSGNPLEMGLATLSGCYRAVSVAREFTSRVGDPAYLKKAAGLGSEAIAAAAFSILKTN